MRAYIKKLVQDKPALFPFAKAVYRKGRLTVDYLRFATRHPLVPWVCHSRAAIAQFKREGFNSQLGQDRFLSDLFKKLKGEQHTGFFVDVGANEPIRINNSLYFERLGWTGLAIDPIQRFQAAWLSSRKTPLISAAVSEEVGRKPFVEILCKEGWEHMLSGFKDCVRQGDIELYGCREYEVPTAPLSQLVPDGKQIDLLLIDVEGAEKLVINGADLGKLRPHVIMVENVSVLGGAEDVRRLIQNHGYRLCARVGAADDVFVADGV